MRQYPTRKSYQYHGKSCMSGKCWNHQEFYDSFHIAGTPERHKRYFRNFPRKDSRLEQGDFCPHWQRKAPTSSPVPCRKRERANDKAGTSAVMQPLPPWHRYWVHLFETWTAWYVTVATNSWSRSRESATKCWEPDLNRCVPRQKKSNCKITFSDTLSKFVKSKFVIAA